jgi:hypothetical protein
MLKEDTRLRQYPADKLYFAKRQVPFLQRKYILALSFGRAAYRFDLPGFIHALWVDL